MVTDPRAVRVGSTYPEEFWNCADVSITGSPTTPRPTPAPTTPFPTSNPTTHGPTSVGETFSPTSAPTDAPSTVAQARLPALPSANGLSIQAIVGTQSIAGTDTPYCMFRIQLNTSMYLDADSDGWTIQLDFTDTVGGVTPINAELNGHSGKRITLQNTPFNAVALGPPRRIRRGVVGDTLSVGADLFGGSARQLQHHFGQSLTPVSAIYRPTHAV